MEPMTKHSRSTFPYCGSEKGGEVGARNEAAFMNYSPSEPRDVAQRYAMPHIVNLMTITPVYLSIFMVGSVAWGVVLWKAYAEKHYEVVFVERPAQL